MIVEHGLSRRRGVRNQTKMLIGLFLFVLLISSFYVSSIIVRSNGASSANSSGNPSKYTKQNNLSVTAQGDVKEDSIFTVSLDGQGQAVTTTLLLPLDTQVTDIKPAGECQVVGQSVRNDEKNKVVNVTVSASKASVFCSGQLYTFRMTKLPAANPFTIEFSTQKDANIVADGAKNVVGPTFNNSFTSTTY